jgi:hypothetical protein
MNSGIIFHFSNAFCSDLLKPLHLRKQQHSKTAIVLNALLLFAPNHHMKWVGCIPLTLDTPSAEPDCHSSIMIPSYFS